VLEVVENYAGNTYRAVYTVKFRDAIYVLHAFQKKSKRGISTPKTEMDVVGRRLQWAVEWNKGR
jgi:phage-related protein